MTQSPRSTGRSTTGPRWSEEFANWTWIRRVGTDGSESKGVAMSASDAALTTEKDDPPDLADVIWSLDGTVGVALTPPWTADTLLAESLVSVTIPLDAGGLPRPSFRVARVSDFT